MGITSMTVNNMMSHFQLILKVDKQRVQ